MEYDHRNKAQLFKDAFIPPPPEVELPDIGNEIYASPLVFPLIMEEEVHRTIENMGLRKAPGRNGIFTHILQQLLPHFKPHLVQLYNACLEQQYCPEHFRQSITVVLPKLGKKDRTEIKSYRPIVLLNRLGKALESMLA